MKRLINVVGFLLLLFLVAAPTQAQEVGTIQALATVMSSLTVNGMTNLNFGAVAPGVNKTVDKLTDANAGEWSIVGSASTEVTLEFTLPDSLTHSLGLVKMAVAFAATDASYDDESGGGQGAPTAVINPASVTTANLGAGGTMSVWIGGTAMPTVAQTGGAYSADVVITVTYTGN